MVSSVSKRKTREEILDLSASLFAKSGYEGVSMRDVASAVGLTQAALYYHFSDKDQLYLDAVASEFRQRESALKALLAGVGTPWQRLEVFVAGFVRMATSDKTFTRLMQWVQLDTDEARQRVLAEQVFKDVFVAICDLAREEAPHHDAHLFAMSILGLVLYPCQTGAIRRYMPGYRPQQNDPEVLARHICDLLRSGLIEVDADTPSTRQGK